MSKTKKTRPLYVRMADHTDNGVEYAEHHDHSGDKECDLAPSPVEAFKNWYLTHERGNCYYEFKFVGKNICGCPICTDKDGRKMDNRRKRHEKSKEVAVQLADMDA